MPNENNVVEVHYQATGKSSNVDALGMREMQSRAYAARQAKYLLIKAPPASGKSRALMFIALDKLKEKKVAKVIVAVPERSIGKSFFSTPLKSGGFHSDWVLPDKYNLCIPGGEKSKVTAVEQFLNSDQQILVCTHSTLRFAFERLGAKAFKKCLVAIDEFHHVSADYDSKLGELVRGLIADGNAHILAMTGSYFRGDSIPVLTSEDEAKFFKVTYNYYEQLNGYRYLKSLGIGFHFYTGRYTAAISEILDTDKKTIIHIPSVNSGESTKDKLCEVDAILDAIGTDLTVDEHNIFTLTRSDGKKIRVADLVNDDPAERDKVIEYLRNVTKPEDVDIIIALGMAKEGFDWPFCEHALTIGYRGSLTEIVQIIGRCTRDSATKSHAQFTNLIAAPDAERGEVVEAVNNMLKAISASLLMEQVLAPKFNFKPKSCGGAAEADDIGVVRIKGLREPSTQRVKDILDTELTELKAAILQDPQVQQSLCGGVDPDLVNRVLIPKVVLTRYPTLSDDEREEVRQHLVTDMVLRCATITTGEGNRKFINLSGKFINIEELDIDLIDAVNPFQAAFEVLSKSLTPKVLKAIQECIASFKVSMTDDEATILWPKINTFVRAMGREPSTESLDATERRLAEALAYLRELKRRQKRG